VAFDASPETSTKLGIDRWTVALSPGTGGGAQVTVRGEDGAGKSRAAFDVGVSDASAAEGVVTLSIDGLHADVRWGADGHVMAAGFDALDRNLSAARVLKRYVEDVSHLTSSSLGPQDIVFVSGQLIEGKPWEDCFTNLSSLTWARTEKERAPGEAALKTLCIEMHGA
jgi:hypothetical protein